MNSNTGSTSELMGLSGSAYPVLAKNTQPATAQRRPAGKYPAVAIIEEAVILAAAVLRPDELSGRKLIHRLMPSMYMLRQKGFSFIQITQVLNDAVGDSSLVKLNVATVRGYYNEFLAERLDECQENLKTAMQVFANVEKLTSKTPQVQIAHAVDLKTAITTACPTTPTAGSRIVAGQAMRSNISGGIVGDSVISPPLRAAEVLNPPPPSAAEKSPSATGIKTRIVESSPVAATVAPPTSHQDAPQFDEIPIPPQPQGQQMALPPKGVATQHRKDGVDSLARDTIVCITVPTVENMHPSNSDHFDNNAQEFFSEALLEHPKIPGLLLTKNQRLCKGLLQYTVNGSATKEDANQLRARLKWTKAVPQFKSRTQGDFVPMNKDLFKKPESS